jgi:hypothetical protein
MLPFQLDIQLDANVLLAGDEDIPAGHPVGCQCSPCWMGPFKLDIQLDKNVLFAGCSLSS